MSSNSTMKTNLSICVLSSISPDKNFGAKGDLSAEEFTLPKGKDVKKRCKRYAQYLAAFSANLSIVTAGMMYGWSSPALRKIELTADEESWIASILMIGGAVGCVLTSLLIDRIGRKWTIILTTMPSIVSWAMIFFSEEHIYLLYGARFIGGLSVGASCCVLPMYIGEISDDSIRGAMGSLLDLSLSIGILIEYTIGPYISFKLLSVISILIPIMNLLFCQFIPESPYFYCMKGNVIDARHSLEVLRGKKNVDEELITLNEIVAKELKERLSCIKLFTKYGNRHALLITFGLMTAMQFSGIGALLSYTEDLFTKTGGNVDPRISTIGVGIAQLIACVISTIVADNYGRRILLLISAVGSALCLSATGAIFFMSEVEQMDTTSIADFSIATIIFYMILVNVGLSSQTYVLLGELFPTNIKAVAVCAANLYMLLMEGIVTKMFIVFKTLANGYYLSFWIFGVCTFLSFIFIILFVPETNGKSLEEIQVWLNKNKPTKKRDVIDTRI